MLANYSLSLVRFTSSSAPSERCSLFVSGPFLSSSMRLVVAGKFGVIFPAFSCLMVMNMPPRALD